MTLIGVLIWAWPLAGIAGTAVTMTAEYTKGRRVFWVAMCWIAPGIALIGLLLLMSRSRRQTEAVDELQGSHPAPPPVGHDPGDDDAGFPDHFTACGRCGYMGIRIGGLRDGVVPGAGEIGAMQVCPRCHFRGIPIEFDDADSYYAFLDGLGAAKSTPDG